MWTATITGIRKNKVGADITYEIYKDGMLFDTQTVTNLNPPNSINQYILQRIKLLKVIDDFDESDLLGDVDVSSIVPTAEQVKLELIAKLADLKKQLEVKFIDQATYDSEVKLLLGQ